MAELYQAEAATAFAATLNGYCVIKADGLAAGKGVIVCSNLAEAKQAIIELLGGRFGQQARNFG